MSQRNRQPIRKYFNSEVVTTNYNYDPPIVSINPQQLIVEDRYIISDDDPTRKSEWKDCQHWQYTVDGGLQYGKGEIYESMDHYAARRLGRTYENDRGPFDPLFFAKPFVKEAVAKALQFNRPDWDTVAQAAVPSLRNEFNTINFLLEIDDLPKLLKSVPKLARRGRFHADAIRKRRLDLEYLGRDVIDAYLEYNLGAVPFFSDMKTLNQNLLDFFVEATKRARKIERARRNLERGLTASTRRFGEAGQQLNYKTGGVYDSTTGAEYLFALQGSLQVRDHVKVCGSFGGPNPFAWFLDNAGIYPDLSTLWNAVPFSFLVDYVLPVGKTLEAEYGSWSWQTAGLFGRGIRLKQAMTSVKVKGTFQYAYIPHLPDPRQSSQYSFVLSKGTPVRITGSFSYYERFLDHGAVLDGTDLKLKDKDLDTVERQAYIGSGILANAYQGAPTRKSILPRLRRR